jgi:hypothetical protein
MVYIMSDLSLIPVHHKPDVSDVSLVPVDRDPFSADGALQQAGTQQGQSQRESPPQQPAMGAGQPDVGAPAIGDVPGGSQFGGGFSPTGDAGDDPDPTSDQGGAEPAPFGGYANPAPTESLVNHAKMYDQEKLIEADRTGKKGDITDGGELYKLVSTGPTFRYPIDAGAGVIFAASSPFYAYDGARYATSASISRDGSWVPLPIAPLK